MSQGDTIDCGICFDVFDSEKRIPKLLECGHTLCLVCLEETKKLLSEKLKGKNKGKYILIKIRLISNKIIKITIDCKTTFE